MLFPVGIVHLQTPGPELGDPWLPLRFAEPIDALTPHRAGGRRHARQDHAEETFRVLIVDDEAALRSAVAGFLRDEGFVVDTATNGSQALDRVQRHRPALILLDIGMPVMDGWDFVRHLRERGIDIPLVVMTAAANARQWAIELGATAYVTKPISLPLLVNRLDDILGKTT